VHRLRGICHPSAQVLPNFLEISSRQLSQRHDLRLEMHQLYLAAGLWELMGLLHGKVRGSDWGQGKVWERREGEKGRTGNEGKDREIGE